MNTSIFQENRPYYAFWALFLSLNLLISPIFNIPVSAQSQPTVAVGLKLLTADDTGTSNTDSLTKDNTPRFEVCAATGHALQLYRRTPGTAGGGTLISPADVEFLGQNTSCNGITGDAIKKTITSVVIPDGEHEIFALSGLPTNTGRYNLANISNTITVTIDTEAARPVPSITDTGSDTTDGVTNERRVDIAGLEELATWEYEIDDDLNNWLPGAGTNFNLKESTAKKSYKVRQTDQAGNQSEEGSLALVIFDRTSPSITPAGIPDQEVEVNTAFRYEIPDGTFTDTHAITYAATGHGEGISFNLSTKIWTGTPTTVGTREVTVTATDLAGNEKETTFNIDVISAAAASNNPPTDITIGGSSEVLINVVENTTLVGQLAAVDTDTGDSHTYSLESEGTGNEDNDKFEIDSSNRLSFKAANTPDFEIPTDTGGVSADNIYSVKIKTNDGTVDFEKVFGIRVTNANEVVTFTIEAIPDATVREGVAYTSPTPVINGTPNGDVTYSRSGADQSAFAINSSTGLVRMIARDYDNPIDADTSNDYEITIIATDTDTNTASTSWTVSVTEAPAVNNAPTIDAFTLATDIAVSRVHRITITDPNDIDTLTAEWKYVDAKAECTATAFNTAGTALTLSSDANSAGKTADITYSGVSNNGKFICVEVSDETVETYGVSEAAISNLINTETATIDPATHSAVIPSGLIFGDKFRLLFVTFVESRGVRSIDGANSHVQSRADTITLLQSVSSKFKALVSAVGTDARDNTGTNTATGSDIDSPIYWHKGLKVADSYADFYDGNWDSREGRDERGQIITRSIIVTGTTSTGEASPGKGIDVSLSTIGRTGGTTSEGQEIDRGSTTGVANFALYGLSPVFTIDSQTNAEVVDLEVSLGTLSPAFDKDTPAYTLSIGAANDSITITPTVAPSASFVIAGTAADNSTPLTVTGAVVSGLTLGVNTVTIITTSGDTNTTETYTLTITKGAAPTNSLPTISSIILPTTAASSRDQTITVTDANNTDTLTAHWTYIDDKANCNHTNFLTGGTELTLSGSSADNSAGRTATITYSGVENNAKFICVRASDGTGTNGLAYATSINAISGLTAATSTPTISINTISGDGFVNAAEEDADVEVSGTSTNIDEGQTISLTFNYIEISQRSAAVGSDGTWSTDILSSQIKSVPSVPITVTASYTGATAATQTFESDPVAPRLVTEIPNQTATVGTDFSFTIPTDTFTDTNSLSYTSSALTNGLTFATDTWSGVGSSITEGTVTVTVTATDIAGNTRTDEFIITIIAAPVANSAPTGITLSNNSVAENTKPVGTFTTTDSDDNSHTYSLAQTGAGNEDNDKFTITGNAIAFTTAPDFETPRDAGGTAGDNKYSVRVQTTDGTSVFSKAFIITVTDVVERVVTSTAETANIDATTHASFIPTGITDGQSFRLIFVTNFSESSQPAESSIERANTRVQTVLAASTITAIAGYSSQFRALVSTEAVDARDNTDTNTADGDTTTPIYWLQGEKVADSYAEFYNGSWDSRAGKNENGGDRTPSKVFTGSTSDGTVDTGFGIEATQTTFGDLGGDPDSEANGVEGEEIDSTLTSNSGNQAYYAISPIFTIAAPSTDATLSSLGVSDGVLYPQFDSSITEYRINTANDSITITTDTTDSPANFVINGTNSSDAALTISSGEVSGLTVGYNTVEIVVTAEDGTTTKTYNLGIERTQPIFYINPINKHRTGIDVTAGAQFGQSSANIGDLDGDGFDEIAVGAHYGQTQNEPGEVHILFMNSDATVRNTVKIDKNSPGLAIGTRNGFGYSIANLGDLDIKLSSAEEKTNSKTTIAVGGIYDGTGGSNRGAVHLINLNSSGAIVGTPVKIVHGSGGLTLANTSWFGTGVVNLGDLNIGLSTSQAATSVTTMAIGASGAHTVYIVNIDSNGAIVGDVVLINNATSNLGLDTQGNSRDWFGISVESLGDLDGTGDGIVTLAVGAYGDNVGSGSNVQRDSGSVRLINIDQDGDKVGDQVVIDRDTVPAIATALVNADDFFGAGVANLGDVDGDGPGKVALAIGAPTHSQYQGKENAGIIILLTLDETGSMVGELNSINVVTSGIFVNANDNLGCSVSNIGDINKDGRDDIAFGQCKADSGIGLLYISSTFPTNHSVKTGDAVSINLPKVLKSVPNIVYAIDPPKVLPTGLTLDRENARITGTSTEVKKESYALHASNSAGTRVFSTFRLDSKTINADPTDIVLSGATANAKSIVEDTTAVGTFTTTDADVSDSHTYTLVSGTGAEDNDKFTLVESTGVITFTTAPDFETPRDAGDTAGDNTYAIRVQTSDGTATYVKTFIITVTATPTPTITITTPISDNGYVGAVEANAGITVSGTSSDIPAAIRVNFSGIASGRLVNPESDGTWSITFPSSSTGAAVGDLSEGTITVDAYDHQNSTKLATETFIYDTTAPAVANAISGQDATEGTLFTFQFASNVFSDTNTPITYTSDVSSITWLSFVPATRTFTGTPSASDAGSETIRVTATDAAGNTATNDFTITIAASGGGGGGGGGDSRAPTVTGIQTSSPTTITIDLDEAVSGTVATSEFTVSDNTVTGAALTTTTQITLTVGTAIVFGATPTVTYTGTALVDAAGNALATFTSESITNIVPAPTILIDTIEGDDVVNNAELNSVQISGTSTGIPNNGVIDLTFDVSAVTAGDATVTNNAWEYAIPKNQSILLPQGQVTVTASYTGATDVERTFDVDAVLPRLVTEIPDQTATVGTDFTFQIPANTFTDTNTLAYTSSALTNGLTFATDTWSGVGSSITEGTVTVIVTATDVAGNTRTDEFIITIAAAPVANSAPTDITLDNLSVPENTTAVGTFTTTDTDDTSHTYTLVAGTGGEDNAKFTLVESTGVIAFKAANTPDFENPTDLGDTAGDNTYAIRVQTTDGTSTLPKEFIIKVTDVDETDADLSGLTVAGATLAETFAVDTVAYTSTVENSVTSVTITPTVSHSEATVAYTFNGVGATSTITLADGTNTIAVIVTAEDGSTTKTYTITITRAAAPGGGGGGGGGGTPSNSAPTIEAFTLATNAAPSRDQTITVTDSNNGDTLTVEWFVSDVCNDANRTIASGAGVLTDVTSTLSGTSADNSGGRTATITYSGASIDSYRLCVAVYDGTDRVYGTSTNKITGLTVAGPEITVNAISGGYVNDAEDESDIAISGTSARITSRDTITLVITDSGSGSVTKTPTVTTNAWGTTLTSAEMKGLAEGIITVTASYTGATPETQTFTYDRTAPATPTLALANDTGSSNSDGITSDATVNVTGLETNATWEWTEDGTDGVVDGSGTSFELRSNEGAYNYEVTQTDLAGNSASSIAYRYDHDANAPILNNAISDQTATVGTSFTYAVPSTTFREFGSPPLTYTSSGEGAGITFATNTWSGNPNNAETLSITLTATDVAGNTQTDEFDIVIAAAATSPTITSFSLTAGNAYTKTETLTFSDPDNTDTLTAVWFPSGENNCTEASYNTVTGAGNGVPITLSGSSSDNSAGRTGDITYFIPSADSAADWNNNRYVCAAVTDGTTVITQRSTDQFSGLQKNRRPTIAFDPSSADTSDKQTFDLTINVTDLDSTQNVTAKYKKIDSSASCVATTTDTGATDITAAIGSTNGKTVTITLNSEDDNDKKMCVTAEDNSGIPSSVTGSSANFATPTASPAITGIDVTAPVLADDIDDQTATVGTDFTFQIPTNTFTDTNALTYTSSALTNGLTFATDTWTGTGSSLTAGTVTVTVTATDAAGNTATDEFTIRISAAPVVNNAPTGITLSSNSVVENTTAVGTLSTTDADGSDSHTYSLVSGTGSEDNAKFTLTTGGELSFTSAPDFEVPTDAGDTAGNNTYSVRVQTSDGTATYQEVFIITVTDAQETDADLANLVVTGATVTPTFSSSTTAYSGNVENSVTSVTVTPTISHSEAVVTVDGNAATSESASTVNLSVGSNTIDVVVTAEDGSTTKTYTITITRAAAPSPTNNAPTDITLSSNSVVENTTAVGTFATTDSDVSDSHTYTLVSGTGDEDNAKFTLVESTGVITFTTAPDFETPTDLGDTANNNTYSVRVQTSDGAATYVETFIITVTDAQETDADLSGLTVTGATVTPTFSSSTTAYSGTVENSVASVTITPTVSHSEATTVITNNAATVTNPITLVEGTNTIVITVTAEDGSTTKTYTITITRAAAPGGGGGGGGTQLPTPTPTIAISTISTDGYVNDVEDESAVTISGTTTNIADSETISLTFSDSNITATTATVASNGTWSTTIPSAQIKAAAEGTIIVTAAYSGATSVTQIFTYDRTAPTVSTARTGNERISTNRIIIEVNENLVGTATASDFTASYDGVTNANPTSASIENRNINLTFSEEIERGDTITVSYSGTSITDFVGNPLSAITNRSVQNDVRARKSGGGGGGGIYILSQREQAQDTYTEPNQIELNLDFTENVEVKVNSLVIEIFQLQTLIRDLRASDLENSIKETRINNLTGRIYQLQAAITDLREQKEVETQEEVTMDDLLEEIFYIQTMIKDLKASNLADEVKEITINNLVGRILQLQLDIKTIRGY